MTPRTLFGLNALPKILIGQPQNWYEQLVLWLGTASATGILLAFPLWWVTGVSQALDTSRYTLVQRFAIGEAAVSAVGYILILVLGGLIAVGRQTGRRNPISQLLYTLGKVMLLLFLPAALITGIILLIAYFSHAPGLSGQ